MEGKTPDREGGGGVPCTPVTRGWNTPSRPCHVVKIKEREEKEDTQVPTR